MSIKIKLLRLLTKRPYGLAKFKVGKTKYNKMVNFANDHVEWFGGVYSFNRDAITIEKSAGKGSPGQKNVYKTNEYTNFEEGFPVIEFDAVSGLPLRDQTSEAQNVPTAKAIQATVKKWIAAKELELMRKQKSKLMTAMLICIIMTLASIMISVYLLIKLGNIEASTQSMSGTLTNIQQIIAIKGV